MKIIRPAVCFYFFLLFVQCSTDQVRDPYLIMISIDGFRHDYPELYDAKNIIHFAEQGVRAEELIPSFPSKTFPNHYTLVTGLYPEHHGIVANTFYDPVRKEIYKTSDRSKVQDGSWYGGTPLWVLAENQKVISASYFWVGSEAEIKGTRPTYYKVYNGDIPEIERINQVTDWLQMPEKVRPHFIMLYFELVDDAGHYFGPDSPETGAAVQKIDSLLGYMYNTIEQLHLDINYMLVSDHGMKKVDQENPIDISKQLGDTTLTIIPGDAFIMIYSEDSAKIENKYQQLSSIDGDFDIYHRKDVPEYLKFNDNKKIGDLVLMAHPPRVFGITGTKIIPGHHGFDPYNNPDMGATFIAWGPAFKSGLTVNAFENVNVYPLAAKILNLKYDENKIDGRLEKVKEFLKH